MQLASLLGIRHLRMLLSQMRMCIQYEGPTD
jgi:hypothetical protein